MVTICCEECNEIVRIYCDRCESPIDDFYIMTDEELKAFVSAKEQVCEKCRAKAATV